MGSSQSNSNELTLEYWEIYISEGFSAAIHGEFTKIIEIHVPQLNISINKKGNPLNIFETPANRYDNKIKDMSNQTPKLINTIRINKISQTATNLIWLSNLYKLKKDKENSLIKLFESPNI